MSDALAGPTRHRHPEGRAARQAAADAFFARTYTPAEIERLQATPPDLLARLNRDHARARAAYAALVDAEARARAAEVREARLAKARAERQQQRQDAQKQQERKRAKREYARQWYARNRQHYLEYQKAYRAAAKQADPDRYGELQRGRNQRWRDSHKEQRNQVARESYREHADPVGRSRRRAERYADHADELAAKKRQERAARPEHAREVQRRWAARERLRHDAGLPTRRIHHVPRTEREANDAAATAFFTQPVTPERRQQLRRERPVDPEAHGRGIRRDRRDAAARHFDALLPDLNRRRELETARRIAASIRERERAAQDAIVQAQRAAEEAAEEARMDEIGRAVNARLRQPPDPRHRHHNDPAAPHTVPGTPPVTGGLHR